MQIKGCIKSHPCKQTCMHVYTVRVCTMAGRPLWREVGRNSRETIRTTLFWSKIFRDRPEVAGDQWCPTTQNWLSHILPRVRRKRGVHLESDVPTTSVIPVLIGRRMPENSSPAWSTQWVLSQPELHSRTLYKIKTSKGKKHVLCHPQVRKMLLKTYKTSQDRKMKGLGKWLQRWTHS